MKKIIISIFFASIILLASLSSVIGKSINDNDDKEIFDYDQKPSNEIILSQIHSSLDNLKNKYNELKNDYESPGIILGVLGLIVDYFFTVLVEYETYVDYYEDNYQMSSITKIKLFFISVFINTLTNPISNIFYMLIYSNAEFIEFWATFIEIFMIFVLFNVLFVNISFEDAKELSNIANENSYLFCLEINKTLRDIVNNIFS